MSEATTLIKELSPAQLSRLFTSLGLVFDSGIQLSEGLELLRNSSATDREQQLLAAMAKGSSIGGRLSDAASQTGGLPPYALALLRVAEQTGQLASTCHALAVYYDKRDRLATAIRSALFYPLAMMVAIFVVVVMLLTQAMPIFDQVLAQFGFEMSGMASAFLSAGRWLRGAALWLSSIAFGLIVLVFVLRQLPIGKRFFSWFYEWNPVTSSLSFRLSLQRLMLGFSTMLRSGMTPQAAMEFVTDLIDDSRVRSRLGIVQLGLSEGLSFQKAFDDSQLVPADSQLLVAVGFRTGSNAEAFEQIANRLEVSTERQMMSLVSAIEPTLVAIMTVLVGVILLSVMLPLLGVLTNM
ncbi:MAG: type II secretion system F family protein [Coriobacteriia bacterium]|nr:type II secretion system F family protein [Coriobacteriia bacterium]